MSIPTLAYAERTLRDTTLRQIDGDSADARRWRLFCHMTGFTGGAAEAAQRYNDMTAQLAQYAARRDAEGSAAA